MASILETEDDDFRRVKRSERKADQLNAIREDFGSSSGELASRLARDSAFRDDINGIRAIAVLAVVLYHFHSRFVGGGYLGVDMFFVVSGYLMTRIIVGGIERGDFNVLDFYWARFRRIVPALAIMLTLVCAVAALLVDPFSSEDAGKDALASLTFWSNVLYARQGGYFGKPPETNWLLHTWSLSVEWQFYLLYPIFLMALHRFGLRRAGMRAAIAAVGGLSLILAIALAYRGGSLADWGFYNLPSRGWELCVGALCAFSNGSEWLSRRARLALHLSGFLVMCGACFGVSSLLPFQPVWILIPTLAVSAIIVAHQERPVWAANVVVAALGRWSYSLYLWHWPIAASVAYWRPDTSALATFALILAAIALSALSYELIEKRLTRAFLNSLPVGSRAFAVAATVAMFGALPIAAMSTHDFEAMRTAGYPATTRAALADFRTAASDWRWPGACSDIVKISRYLSACVVGAPDARETLVIGDSQVQQITPRYARAYPEHHGITFLAQSACLPLPGVANRKWGTTCGEWIADAFSYAQEAGFKRVVVSALWYSYFDSHDDDGTFQICFQEEGGCEVGASPERSRVLIDRAFGRLADTLRRLHQRGTLVTVMAPYPGGREADPRYLYRNGFATGDANPRPLREADFRARSGSISRLLSDSAASAGAHFVDPAERLCDHGECPTVIAGKLIYKDGAHFRSAAVTDTRFGFLDEWIVP